MIGKSSCGVEVPTCSACGRSLQVVDRRRWGVAALVVSLMMAVVSMAGLFINIDQYNILGFDWASTVIFGVLGIWILRGKRYYLRCKECRTSKMVDKMDITNE